MRRTILLAVTLCVCLLCNAQVEVRKGFLTANTWKVVRPDLSHRQTWTFKFKGDNTLEQTITSKRSKQTYTLHYKYYLTNILPTRFEPSKIGKSKSGKYLVYANTKDTHYLQDFVTRQRNSIGGTTCFYEVHCFDNKRLNLRINADDDSLSTFILERTRPMGK